MYVRGHEYLLGPSPWFSSEKGLAFYSLSLKRPNMQRLKKRAFKTPCASIVLELLTDNIMWFLTVGSKIGLMFQSMRGGVEY